MMRRAAKRHAQRFDGAARESAGEPNTALAAMNCCPATAVVWTGQQSGWISEAHRTQPALCLSKINP